MNNTSESDDFEPPMKVNGATSSIWNPEMDRQIAGDANPQMEKFNTFLL